MASASTAKVQIESGQTHVDYEALTDIGDNQVFNPSATVMSSATTPNIRPNGLLTGGTITVDTTADTVNVAALTCWLVGVQTSVAADALTVTRPATDVSKVNSITVTSAGEFAVIAGTDGASSAFSESRGVAGGPPYIPVGSIEIGQVRMTTSASAVITTSEIKQNGQYTEKALYPVWTLNPIGLGNVATDAGTTNAYIKFSEALDLAHTGDLPKAVYAAYDMPSYADVPRCSDFTPAENSHSISSEDTYDGPVGSSSSSLGQASFSCLLDDGVSDLIATSRDKNLTVKFFPNRSASAHVITQGKVGISRSYPASGGQINASVTVTPEVASAGFAS